ncbi:hypothetical protein BD410DRAFT_898582 [Rickenella mellea]|uniref:Uncharacterized protein n=1 Tax=Rickenella mellea TaxID=50990 RepID=A0A4Y7Q3W1_9AGAM|nr:hypothetical protein BD410DRAFT_898582 [Rickenella mellea]
MDNFSWTDGVRAALSSCLPCLVSRTTTTTNNGNGIDSTSSSNAHQERSGHRQSQYDELEGLLADSGETTDTDAETVSLHSNLGDRQHAQRRRKRKKNSGRKVIRLFGWDLFGKPPIALEESDDEGGDGARNRRKGRGRRTAPPLSLTSSLTMDSDARPLDPATIEQLSSPPPRTTSLPTSPSPHTSPSKHQPQHVDGDTILEQEARRLKEEREERKRERRALKRAAKAIALGIDDTEFEGFQGSGPGFPSPYTTRSSQAPSSPSTYASPGGVGGGGGQGSEFGPFVHARSEHGSQYQYHDQGLGGDDDEGDDAPDFGGEVYTRNARPTGGSTGSGSQSQSRGTSASQSQSNPPQYIYNHHYISQAHMVPLPPTPSSDGRLSPRVPNAPAPSGADTTTLPTSDQFPPPKKTKKSSSSSSSKRSSKSRSSTSKNSKSNSSASTSQSQSIPSPVTSTFPEPRVQVRLPPQLHQVQAPHPYALARSAREGSGVNGDREEGEGDAFAFDGSKNDVQAAPGGGGFPSTGFFGGAAGGMRRKNSDMGAFLARRGDD